MIQKISRPGAGFRGVLNYALGPSKNPELVAGNMAGENARDLAREFADARAANEAVGKPVFHASLSADPGDQVTPETWRAIAETYVERMGYGESLWLAVRHRDTDHDHLHIIASRIAHDGTRVQDRQERKRGEAIVRDLERDHGLRQMAPSREADRAAITRDELAAFERAGQVSVKARLQEHLDVAARDRPAMGEFAQRLQVQGIGVRVQVASTGRISGISFELDGVAVKGSDVGRAYSWRGLQERKGVSYEAERDLPVLRGLSPPGAAPSAPHRPAAPMPPLVERPVAVYRQAAELVVRVDLHDRRTEIDRAAGELHAVMTAGREVARDHERAELDIKHREAYVLGRLGEVYQDPAAALGRLRELVDHQGYARAAAALEQAPAELGRLRGLGAGPLANEARRGALQAAGSIAEGLRGVGDRRAERAAQVPRERPLLDRLPEAQRRHDRLVGLLRHLPGFEVLRRDMGQAAQALGAAVVQAVSLRAAHLVAGYLKRMARDIALGRDEGRGR